MFLPGTYGIGETGGTPWPAELLITTSTRDHWLRELTMVDYGDAIADPFSIGTRRAAP